MNKLLLDGMKWRLNKFCKSILKCEDCILKGENECNFFILTNPKDVDALSEKQIIKLYNIIKNNKIYNEEE